MKASELFYAELSSRSSARDCAPKPIRMARNDAQFITHIGTYDEVAKAIEDHMNTLPRKFYPPNIPVISGSRRFLVVETDVDFYVFLYEPENNMTYYYDGRVVFWKLCDSLQGVSEMYNLYLKLKGVHFQDGKEVVNVGKDAVKNIFHLPNDPVLERLTNVAIKNSTH